MLRYAVVAVILVGAATLPSSGAEPPGAGRIKVMTFNVLCSFCNPSEYGSWRTRLPYIGDVFARHDPDLIGVQELVNASEVAQLKTLLPGHDAVFYQKKKRAHPDSTIFYRRSRFKLLDSGVYWLGPKPDRPFCRGWSTGLSVPRCVVWAKLEQHKGGARFLFITTHFDNNTPNKQNSAPLFVERTASIADGLPVIATGDFNLKPDSQGYAALASPAANGLQLLNTYDLVPKRRTVTNQKPPPSYDSAGRIDHIWLAGPAKWTVHDWAADLTVYGKKRRYPSDHRPIVGVVEY